MFSGIVEQVGQVKNFKKSKKENNLSVNINLSEISLNIGDSVAVNGVCLTVSKMTTDKCHFDISPETLSIAHTSNIKKAYFAFCDLYDKLKFWRRILLFFQK